jgi:hypothetical protein
MLDGRLQRGCNAGLKRCGRFEEQAVAAVLHIGNDAAGTRRQRILLVVRVVLLIFRPVSTLDVQNEAILSTIAPAAPAQVNAPQGCRMPIGERCQISIIAFNLGGAASKSATVYGKADPGLQLIAEPQPFFLVRVDLVRSLCRHVLGPEKRLQRDTKPGTAPLAAIEAMPCIDGVQIATGVALLDGCQRNPVAFTTNLTRGSGV